MEGSKLKNIVIIILLLLNAFLLVLIGGRRAQDTHSHDAARDSAIQIIRNSGIALADETVPREMSHPGLQAARDLEWENTLSAALLGSDRKVIAQGGDVYRYESSLGWLQLHGTGEFQAEFASGAFPVEKEPLSQHAVRLLSTLDFEAVVLEEHTDRVVVRQTVHGAPVLGSGAVLHYQGGCLARITEGRRVPGQPQPGGNADYVSAATALMRLYNGLNELGDVYNRIDSMEPAYTLNVNMSGPAQLTPVWYVKTDTGAYQLDTHTGQISRVGAHTGVGPI